MYANPTVWVDEQLPAINAAALNKIESAIKVVSAGGFYLDSYGGTDDQRLTAAIADQQASGGTYNYAPIILPPRPITFNQTRTLYTGCNIVGVSGARTPEIASGNYEGPEITLGSSISSGTSSWWNGTGQVYGVTMRDFSVQGNQGGSIHQFMDLPATSGTLYLCKFTNLGFNFMRSVFGRKDRIMGFTGVILDGVWTMNNLWDMQMCVGGSDSQLWMGGWVNLGTSQSPSQTGTYADNDYAFNFGNLSKTSVGYIFNTALNGWRGVWVTGNNSSLSFFGGTHEGFKPSRVNGLLGGPAPGTIMRVDAGSVGFHGVNFGQFMDNPNAAENGGVQINGGNVSMFGCHFYGDNTDSVNSIQHTGGRLTVLGSDWMHRTGLTHAGRPKLQSTAPAPSQANLTSTYTLWHDHSMELV